MSKQYLVSLVLLLFIPIGCATGSGPVFERGGIRLSLAQVRNAWLKELNQLNPQLHDVLLVALVESRQTGREVFILKRTLGDGENVQAFYTASLQRGGSENLMSVNYPTREFMFDHFSEADGPTLENTRNRLYNEERIRIIKRDLGIFGIK